MASRPLTSYFGGSGVCHSSSSSSSSRLGELHQLLEETANYADVDSTVSSASCSSNKRPRLEKRLNGS